MSVPPAPSPGLMRAARYAPPEPAPEAGSRATRARGRMEVGELPLPEPGPGEALVRVEACGICGTDLHTYTAGLVPPGHTPGHEMVGRVERLGPASQEGREDAPAVGTRVAVEPLRSCGRCASCRAGRDNICREVRLFGIHMPGGMAEAVAVPTRRLFPVAEDLPAHVAALAEPVAVAVHGLKRGRLERGQRVLVLGSGSVGLVTLVAAHALGAGEIWTTARHARQADLARELGAARVLAESEATPAALAALGLETDFDLVVETVGGHADTISAATAAARPGGVVSVVGVFMGGVALDALSLLLKELTLVGSNCYERAPGSEADFALATSLVDRERERLALLTTHQLPLDEVGRAFEIAADKSTGAVKVTVALDASSGR